MLPTVIGSVVAAAAVLTVGGPVAAVPAAGGGVPAAGGGVPTAGGGAAAPGPAALASYPHSPARPGARAKLTLIYMAEAGYAAAVRLTCEPTGGVHPHAEQACTTLARAGGDPAAIEPAPTMCLLIYAPITAQISGVWDGRAVAWTHKYGNGCEMRRATGELFDF